MTNKNSKALLLFPLAIGCCLLSLFVDLSMGASNFSSADCDKLDDVYIAECIETCRQRQNESYGGNLCLNGTSTCHDLDPNPELPCYFHACICTVGHVRLNYDGTGPCIPVSECPNGVPSLLGFNGTPPSQNAPPPPPPILLPTNVLLNSSADEIQSLEPAILNCDVRTNHYVEECKEICLNRPNEYYGDDCGASIGMSTCEHPEGRLNDKCFLAIASTFSCLCTSGHVRLNTNRTGPCVPMLECPLMVAEPSNGEQNASQSAASPNVSNPSAQNFTAHSPMAPLECSLPSKHYVEECKEICLNRSNEYYGYDCGGHFGRGTCADHNDDNCPFKSVVTVSCLCQIGHVRLNYDGTGPCIPVSECPVEMGQKEECGEKEKNNGSGIVQPHRQCAYSNAHFTKYVISRTCRPSCSNLKPERLCPGILDSRGQCLCKEGYVSELPYGYGRCIKPEECPNKINAGNNVNSSNAQVPLLPYNQCADPNAEFHECASSLNTCLPSCDNEEAQNCTMSKCCEPRCLCKPGYVSEHSNGNGRCLKKEECPEKKEKEKNKGISPIPQLHQCSDPNAELHECLIVNNDCLPSCADPYPDIGFCGWNGGCRSQCVCKWGYVSEHPNGQGRCLKREECPKLVIYGLVLSQHNHSKHHHSNHSHPQNHFPSGNDSLHLVDDKCNPGEHLDHVCHDYVDHECSNPNPFLWKNRQVCSPKKYERRCICRKGYLRKNSDLCVPDLVRCFEE